MPRLNHVAFFLMAVAAPSQEITGTIAGAKLQFRFETFNTFNHTNWASIGATLGSSTFGQVTAARDARIAQLALKLSF